VANTERRGRERVPSLSPRPLQIALRRRSERLLAALPAGHAGGGFPIVLAFGSLSSQFGRHGQQRHRAHNGCVRVRDRFPSWWGVRNMRLETEANGGYPGPFTWSSACTSSGGSGTFTPAAES
jgi:hypothetical protein